MKKNLLRIRKGSFCILLTAFVLFCTGCSIRNVEFLFMDSEEQEAYYHNSPRFWKYAVPIEGTDNLYQVQNDLFLNKPYNNLAKFGDNILLIGEALYQDSVFNLDNLEATFQKEADSIDEGWEDDTVSDEKQYEYSFDLYSPWKNRILTSLSREEISCTRYQIAGDYLFLIDENSFSMAVYDTSLSLVGNYDIAKLCNESTLEFYPTSNAHTFYTPSKDETKLLTFTLDKAELTAKTLELPFYDAKFAAASADGEVLGSYGINPDTFCYELQVMDSNNFSEIYSLAGDEYFIGAVSAHAAIQMTDYAQSYWQYQRFNEESPRYFRLEDVLSVTFTEDDNLLFCQNEYINSDEDFLARYSYYDADGEALSGFSLEFDSYNTPENTQYLSTGIAFFEEAQTAFLLLFDTQNLYPYFLVWDTSSSGAQKTDLALRSSYEALVYEEQSSDSASKAEDFGQLITMIPEPASYDWGTLSQANSMAAALEETYSIQIYLGPEVPPRIDYYDISQELSPETLEAALKKLTEVLSGYPSDFFSQLMYGNSTGMRIYLSGAINGNSEGLIPDPSGFVNEINHSMVMVLDTEACWDWDYTISHEISHLIDRKLAFRSMYVADSLFSEDTWNSFNPPGFEYRNTYEDYEDNTDFALYEGYFYDTYAMTFATEDRAELFGLAMSDYLSNFESDESFTPNSPLTAKYSYYCACIRDGFDTSRWPDQMPWEHILPK